MLDESMVANLTIRKLKWFSSYKLTAECPLTSFPPTLNRRTSVLNWFLLRSCSVFSWFYKQQRATTSHTSRRTLLFRHFSATLKKGKKLQAACFSSHWRSLQCRKSFMLVYCKFCLEVYRTRGRRPACLSCALGNRSYTLWGEVIEGTVFRMDDPQSPLAPECSINLALAVEIHLHQRWFNSEAMYSIVNDEKEIS